MVIVLSLAFGLYYFRPQTNVANKYSGTNTSTSSSTDSSMLTTSKQSISSFTTSSLNSTTQISDTYSTTSTSTEELIGANISLSGPPLIYDPADGNTYGICCADESSNIYLYGLKSNVVDTNFSLPIPFYKFQYLTYDSANGQLWALTANGAVLTINTSNQRSSLIMNLSIPWFPICRLCIQQPPPPFYTSPVFDQNNGEMYLGVNPNNNMSYDSLTDLLAFNSSDSLVANVSINGFCQGISYDPNHANVYCLTDGSRLLSFDGANHLVLNASEALDLGGGSIFYQTSEPQKLFLFNNSYFSSHLLTLNASTGGVIAVSQSMPPVVQVLNLPEADKAFLSFEESLGGSGLNFVGVFDFSSNDLVMNVSVPASVIDLIYNPAQKVLFVFGSNSFSLIDTTTNVLITTFKTSGELATSDTGVPLAPTYDPANEEVYVIEISSGYYHIIAILAG
jgi:hypothetical protein